MVCSPMDFVLGQIHSHPHPRWWYAPPSMSFSPLCWMLALGIGPEISEAVKNIYSAANVRIRWCTCCRSVTSKKCANRCPLTGRKSALRQSSKVERLSSRIPQSTLSRRTQWRWKVRLNESKSDVLFNNVVDVQVLLPLLVRHFLVV